MFTTKKNQREWKRSRLKLKLRLLSKHQNLSSRWLKPEKREQI